MNSAYFEEPVTVLVGLGFPRKIKSAVEAYQLLSDMRVTTSKAAHKAAMQACKAAIDGQIEPQTARSVFVAFARRRAMLLPKEPTFKTGPGMELCWIGARSSPERGSFRSQFLRLLEANICLTYLNLQVASGGVRRRFNAPMGALESSLEKVQGQAPAGPGSNRQRMRATTMAVIQDYPDDNTTGWATILVPPTLVRALDRYITEEAPNMSRPQAMCRALQDWCTEMGYLSSNGMNTNSD